MMSSQTTYCNFLNVNDYKYLNLISESPWVTVIAISQRN